MKWFIFLSASTLFVNCNIINPERIQPESIIPDTPVNLLKVLEHAYNSRDELQYQSILDNDFIFYANVEFIAEPDILDFEYTIDDRGNRVYFWSRDEEIERHKKMFEQINGASSIKLTFPTIRDEDWEDCLLSDSTWGKCSNIGDIHLELTYQSVKYKVEGGKALFKIRKNPDNGLWLISEWYDLGTEL
ncbi:MAG: hypothetical protein ABIA63_06745 [bacterium]